MEIGITCEQTSTAYMNLVYHGFHKLSRQAHKFTLTPNSGVKEILLNILKYWLLVMIPAESSFNMHD